MPTSRAALAALVPFTLFVAACRIQPNPMPEVVNPDSAARSDISAAMATYRTALLQGDATTAASFFEVGGRLHEDDAPDRTGAPAVESGLNDFFSRGSAYTHLSFDAEELHVDGGRAFESGTFEERIRTDGAGEQVVRGSYMVQWRRGPEARWLIQRFMRSRYPADTTAVTDSAGVPADTTS